MSRHCIHVESDLTSSDELVCVCAYSMCTYTILRSFVIDLVRHVYLQLFTVPSTQYTLLQRGMDDWIYQIWRKVGT